MSEYLNRDDVLNCFHAWIDKHGDAHEPDEMEEYRNIEALPSIELVRCKDCKYAEENWNGKDIYCLRTSSFPWSNDSFCSDGERKDGDPDE